MNAIGRRAELACRLTELRRLAERPKRDPRRAADFATVIRLRDGAQRYRAIASSSRQPSDGRDHETEVPTPNVCRDPL